MITGWDKTVSNRDSFRDHVYFMSILTDLVLRELFSRSVRDLLTHMVYWILSIETTYLLKKPSIWDSAPLCTLVIEML